MFEASEGVFGEVKDVKRLVSMFSLKYVVTLVYMLQATEYDAREYMRWVRRAENFRYKNVAVRGKLDWTRKAKVLAGVGYGMELFGLAVAGVAVWFLYGLVFARCGMEEWVCGEWVVEGVAVRVLIAVGVFALTVWAMKWWLAYLVVVPVAVGEVFVQKPIEGRVIGEAEGKLAGHKGVKIAVVGSYGKTTTKEVLRMVLGVGKKVAATEGNINQPLGIAKFVEGLDGDEEVLIFEMGEYRAGDISEMCEWVRPDVGFITGVNEAHLASFGSKDEIVRTLFGLRDFLGEKGVYLNGDSEELRQMARSEDVLYGIGGVDGWKISDVEVDVGGTEFVMKKGKEKLTVRTRLLGEHSVGVVAATVSLALKLGLSEKEIMEGLASVKPFKHRMQPRSVSGATVIDDTYNGNIDGMRAGIRLLKSLEGKKKIYVTPGLVECGEEGERLHLEIGGLLADGVDEVVLMKNSVTGWIEAGLVGRDFEGELKIVEDPVEFYQNLDKFVAAGDVVLMQNDWTDNYA